MLDYLPPLPDAATLATMKAWAAAGATLGFGSVLHKWLAKRGWSRAPAEASIQIPGAPNDREPAPAPWSPSGLLATATGAAIGALMAWGWYGPEPAMRRIGAILAFVGVIPALWQLLRVTRDVPAVGEPVPDDPDKTREARLPGAWGGMGLAVVGVLMALF